MVEIRQATSSDYPAIIGLIQELADFENASDKMTNSVKMMEEEEQYFKCFVAEKEGEVVGMALYFFAYFTWVGKSLYLDDLYVKEELRGQGIGKMLLKEIFKVARETNCKRLRWQVLDWNTSAIEFYKSINATIDEEWYNCDFSIEQLNSL